MPQTIDRSEPRLVGFRCTAEEYRLIVAAAEEDERSVSGWIRKALKQAASLGKHRPPVNE